MGFGHERRSTKVGPWRRVKKLWVGKLTFPPLLRQAKLQKATNKSSCFDSIDVIPFFLFCCAG